MKRLFLALVTVAVCCIAYAQQNKNDTVRREVLLQTNMGNIRIALYNETPLHRDNFIKLVKNRSFDGASFYRVIKDFMIQTGDMRPVQLKPGQKYVTPTVPAEIRYPQLFHKRGAVAAAREDESINPELKSSAKQFYIVTGKKLHDSQVDYYQHQYDSIYHGKVNVTPEVRQAYTTVGGAPYLDVTYTVFGEVIEGMDVVDNIQNVETDQANKPKKAVVITKATVVK